MNTIVIDPNRVDQNGCIVSSDVLIGHPKVNEVVRMLEPESGEYWHATVKKISSTYDYKPRWHLKPLHCSSYGGWINCEQDA